jgi:hypothetical protein
MFGAERFAYRAPHSIDPCQEPREPGAAWAYSTKSFALERHRIANG